MPAPAPSTRPASLAVPAIVLDRAPVEPTLSSVLTGHREPLVSARRLPPPPFRPPNAFSDDIRRLTAELAARRAATT